MGNRALEEIVNTYRPLGERESNLPSRVARWGAYLLGLGLALGVPGWLLHSVGLFIAAMIIGLLALFPVLIAAALAIGQRLSRSDLDPDRQALLAGGYRSVRIHELEIVSGIGVGGHSVVVEVVTANGSTVSLAMDRCGVSVEDARRTARAVMQVLIDNDPARRFSNSAAA